MLFFRFLTSSILALLFVSVSASAAEYQKFTRAAFDTAQAEGRPIIVDVAAWWCPICASQDRTIKKTAAAPQFAKLIIFRIDYDKQKSEWKSFNVIKQGAIIAFKGKSETGRLNFITDKSKIAALIASTVQ
jgi:thioredoxin 1